MFGILNVNKPAGWTSRDVVNRVQRFVRPAKAGHAGTLDPLATGVLVICIGPATRLISYVQDQPKTYEATFLLGQTSPSDDTETDLTAVADTPVPTLAEIEAQLPQFLGTIDQLPPAYSALKVKGQRAYKLAREGKKVELKSRPVVIHELIITAYAYPELKLTMRCGSGTYVRSVGRDLAQSFGTGAVMSALERTAIGNFHVDNAVDIETLDEQQIEQNLSDPINAVEHLPRLEVTSAQIIELHHGRRLDAQELNVTPSSPDEVFAAVDSTGQLIALVSERRPGMLGAVCNFKHS